VLCYIKTMETKQTHKTRSTHKEIITGISGKGNTMWLVVTIWDDASGNGRWAHREDFDTEAEAKSWLKFS